MVDLCTLALSSLVFDQLTAGYTASLSRFVSATGGGVDPGDPLHRNALLKFLNDWGCRHLAREHHEIASASLLIWYQKCGASLFSVDRFLWELTDEEIAAAASSYGSLKDMTGAWRRRDSRAFPVQIGPTAASKVLFALRPKALPPWDEAMRAGFGCDGSPESYLRFLGDVRLLAQRTAAHCQEAGFGISALPCKLGCSGASVAELINKYLWLKHARGWTPPEPDIVAKWAEWGLSCRGLA